MQALDLAPATAEVFLASTATLLVLVAAFISRQDQAARMLRKTSIAALAVAGLLVPLFGADPALAFGGLSRPRPSRSSRSSWSWPAPPWCCSSRASTSGRTASTGRNSRCWCCSRCWG